VEALSIFEFELPSLRTSVDLAEILAEALRTGSIAHPVLTFAFDKTPAAVIENLLLRAAELLEIMDRVRATVGLDTVFTNKRGRDRVPKDRVFQLAWDLRHERIAHRVKMRGVQAPGPSWAHVVVAFGTVWPFIRAVLDGLEASLREIRSAGVPVRIPRNAGKRIYFPFNAEDVAELIKAADHLPGARKGLITPLPESPPIGAPAADP